MSGDAATGPPIRVFIADDHAVLRRSLAQLLDRAAGLEVIGTAADGESVLAAPELARCDVLLLDLSLPGVGGEEVLRQVRARRPALPVVILSMYPEDDYAVHLLRQGAAAYLSKDRSPDDVIAALRQVVQGGTYLTDRLAVRALRRAGDAAEAPEARLSAREREVFRLLVGGRAVKEIAAALELHISTVSNHLRGIKDKLGVTSTAEIIRYAHRLGLGG